MNLEKLLIKYKNEQSTNNSEQAILYGIPVANLLKNTKLYLKDIGMSSKDVAPGNK